jgi:hypothetical protein
MSDTKPQKEERRRKRPTTARMDHYALLAAAGY